MNIATRILLLYSRPRLAWRDAAPPAPPTPPPSTQRHAPRQRATPAVDEKKGRGGKFRACVLVVLRGDELLLRRLLHLLVHPPAVVLDELDQLVARLGVRDAPLHHLLPNVQVDLPRRAAHVPKVGISLGDLIYRIWGL